MRTKSLFIIMILCTMMMGCENPNSGTNPNVGFVEKVPLTDIEQSELDAIFTERNHYLHNYASTLNGENTVNVIGSRAELYDLVGPGVFIGDLKSIDFKKHCIVYGVVRTGSSGNTFSKAELYMQADGKATFQTTIDMISIDCMIGYVFPYAVFDIPKKDIQQITIQVDRSTPKRNKKAFSVSSTEQVVFSMGNLQYHPKNNEWRFAESQWNIIGGANENISTTYDGWIDLFGWSTDGHEATKWGVSTSSDWNDYTGNFVDWGINTIGNDAPNTWRTMSINEWYYLIEQRPHHSELMGIAQVNGVNGTILLPDGWECPDGIDFKPGLYEEHYNYPDESYFAMQQTFTLEQWRKMENAGAIFLPNAGIRVGKNVYNPHGAGCYWSSTRGSNLTACSYEFGGISVATGIINEMHKDARSVRLVKNCD
jgi:hypothetical protein